MRNWLKCAVAIGLAGLAATTYAQEKKPTVNYAAQEKLGWRLASQAYTFREMSLFETIDTLNSIGIRYVELFPGQKLAKDKDVSVSDSMPQDAIEALQAKLKEANVKAVAYGVVGGLGGDEAGSRKIFEFCRKMGIETITAEPPANAYDLLDKLCGEYKISVALHNHPKDSPYWNPDTVLERTKGHSKLIGSCADTGHWARSGLVPIDCLKKLEGRIISLHLKDLNSLSGGDQHDVPWGTGACDFKGMLAEIKRQGFKGVFSIEYETGSGAELKANVAKCVQAFSDAVTELAK